MKSFKSILFCQTLLPLGLQLLTLHIHPSHISPLPGSPDTERALFYQLSHPAPANGPGGAGGAHGEPTRHAQPQHMRDFACKAHVGAGDSQSVERGYMCAWVFLPHRSSIPIIGSVLKVRSSSARTHSDLFSPCLLPRHRFASR